MGESLVLGETLAMGEPIEQVRTAGVINRDYFGIHSPGNSAAVAIEFRLDGVVDTQPAPDVGDPARSIWFEEDGTLTWVAAADGTLRRGDMIIPGEYLWARPTVATTFTTPPDPPVVDVGRGIELDDASLFGLIFGAEVDVDRFVPDVSTQLGEPTLDTGWLPVGDEWSCTGSTDFRTIWWGDVRTTFERSDEPIPRLTAWSVGDPSVAAGAPLGGAPSSVDPSGVVTDRGFGTGATRSEVTSATDDIGIFNDETDRWVVLSNGSATLVQFDDDLVSGIGVSRLDCLEPDPDR
jgi:hypothetical protein